MNIDNKLFYVMAVAWILALTGSVLFMLSATEKADVIDDAQECITSLVQSVGDTYQAVVGQDASTPVIDSYTRIEAVMPQCERVLAYGN